MPMSNEELPSGKEHPGEQPADAAKELTGRQRLIAGLWPPRVTRAQLIVALLLFVLGLGLAIQVRSNNDNSALRGARQEDLVRILDELDGRTQRLEDEKQRLDAQRTELENSSDQAEEARKQTVEKERQLGVLAGTVAAHGPGITLTVNDPGNGVKADMLLDALQSCVRRAPRRSRSTASEWWPIPTSPVTAARSRLTAVRSPRRTCSR